MSFGSRLRDKRKELGITQPKLAELLGVSQSAIGSWETDVNSPRATLLYDLFDILQCDANYLFQDETRELYKDKATPEEFEQIIKDYRNLDDIGKEHIRTLISWELARTQQLQNASCHAAVIEFNGRSDVPARYLEYFHSVSAGTGQVIFDDVYSERIAIPDIPEYRRVAYAVKVSGHSMEPLYLDGDILLIEPTCEIDVGEIGIFNVYGQAYVKKLGENELISLNKEYENIPLEEYSRCMGKVVDRFAV